MEQVGQKLSMCIGTQTVWVEYREDHSQPNPHNGLNYRIWSKPDAMLPFCGASTFAAFVSDIEKIASGRLDEMLEENRKLINPLLK